MFIAVRMFSGFQFPIADIRKSSFREYPAVSREDLENALENSVSGCSRRTCPENLTKAVNIYFGDHGRVTEQCLDFRSEYKHVILHRIKQGLYSQPVTIQHELFFCPVPDSECKYTVEHADKIFAILHICIQDHFRVGRSFKLVACLQQMRLYLIDIVNLTVIYDDIIRTGSCPDHRLCSKCRISDGKACMAEPRMFTKIFSGAVRPPMGDRFPHLCNGLCPKLPSFQKICLITAKSHYSAHNNTPHAI